ncbi:sugar phosphate nucleotidyltransferase [Baia soyae]|uniref:Nucleotidyltransferase-like protein n=1 Tax=Baia soyae TaxID=1544746 RepID=A0A4R2S122_9BACL|nr:sugar phosphate nucleotidyltransferase [Baia soyae]TCP69691.1 nucleotidyltransferase-like protein [Baia soyae]
MHAVIMTGGKGERMRPYTHVFPKGLLPIDGIPLLDILVRQCRYYGFHRITMACGYLATMIQNYFQNGEKWGLEIDYLKEDVPLGTAGALRDISCEQESMLVMNCDILTNLHFRDFYEKHIDQKSMLTIASHEVEVPIDFGVLDVRGERVLQIVEKPTNHSLVSMGIYIIHQDALTYIPKEGKFDIPDLIYTLLDHKERVTHHHTDSFWMDIGRPHDYEKANQIFEQFKAQILPGEVEHGS